MTWRNWSFIVVLMLVNYLVFSVLGSFIFVPTFDSTPTHTPQPTFTPGARALTAVAPLPYTFLTPGSVPGTVRATATISGALPTVAPSQTLTPTRAP